MIGYLAKVKGDLGIRSLNISTGEELQLSGINTTQCIIMMITLLPRQFRATNSTFFIQNYLINKKLLNIISRQQRVLTFAS